MIEIYIFNNENVLTNLLNNSDIFFLIETHARYC